jgi:hypothetical protein
MSNSKLHHNTILPNDILYSLYDFCHLNTYSSDFEMIYKLSLLRRMTFEDMFEEHLEKITKILETKFYEVHIQLLILKKLGKNMKGEREISYFIYSQLLCKYVNSYHCYEFFQKWCVSWYEFLFNSLNDIDTYDRIHMISTLQDIEYKYTRRRTPIDLKNLIHFRDKKFIQYCLNSIYSQKYSTEICFEFLKEYSEQSTYIQIKNTPSYNRNSYFYRNYRLSTSEFWECFLENSFNCEWINENIRPIWKNVKDLLITRIYSPVAMRFFLNHPRFQEKIRKHNILTSLYFQFEFIHYYDVMNVISEHPDFSFEDNMDRIYEGTWEESKVDYIQTVIQNSRFHFSSSKMICFMIYDFIHLRTWKLVEYAIHFHRNCVENPIFMKNIENTILWIISKYRSRNQDSDYRESVVINTKKLFSLLEERTGKPWMELFPQNIQTEYNNLITTNEISINHQIRMGYRKKINS